MWGTVVTPQGLSAPALKSCLPFDSKLRIWWAPEGPLDYGSPGGPSTLREEICLPPCSQHQGQGLFCVLCPLPTSVGHHGHQRVRGRGDVWAALRKASWRG